MKIDSIEKLKEICSDVAAECYHEVDIANRNDIEGSRRAIKFYVVIWYNKVTKKYLLSDCQTGERYELDEEQMELNSGLKKIIEEGRFYLS